MDISNLGWLGCLGWLGSLGSLGSLGWLGWLVWLGECERKRARASAGERGRARASAGERGRASESDGERERGRARASESERERARPSESERDQARASDSVNSQLRSIFRPPSAFKMENRKWTIAGWLAGWLCISEFYTVETSGVYASKLCLVSLEIVSSLWTSSGARPQARASGGTCPHND